MQERTVQRITSPPRDKLAFSSAYLQINVRSYLRDVVHVSLKKIGYFDFCVGAVPCLPCQEHVSVRFSRPEPVSRPGGLSNPALRPLLDSVGKCRERLGLPTFL